MFWTSCLVATYTPLWLWNYYLDLALLFCKYRKLVPAIATWLTSAIIFVTIHDVPFIVILSSLLAVVALPFCWCWKRYIWLSLIHDSPLNRCLYLALFFIDEPAVTSRFTRIRFFEIVIRFRRRCLVGALKCHVRSPSDYTTHSLSNRYLYHALFFVV